MSLKTTGISDNFGEILSEGLGVGVLCVDVNLQVTYWNGWLEKHSNIKKESIIGDSLIEKFPAVRERNKVHYLLKCIEKSIPSILSAHLHQYLIPLTVYKSGEEHRMLQNVKIFPLKDFNIADGAMIIIEDKTVAILHEQAIDKLTNLLRGIRDINRLIVEVQSEKNLYESVCNVLARSIGFRCAWIGDLDAYTLDIAPVCANGIDLKKLQDLSFKWVGSEAGCRILHGHLPDETTKTAAGINEIPHKDSWSEVAEYTDSLSFCILPILNGDQVRGVIGVYAQKSDFFEDDVETLLKEIATDISFGLDVINEKKMRHKAEIDLGEEKKRLETTLRSIGDGVITTDLDGHVVMMNEVAEHMTGWGQEDAVGHPLEKVFNIINEQTRQPCENPIEKVLATKGIIGLANHTLLISRDGREIPIKDSGAPIISKSNKLIGTVLVFQDDTKNRIADRAIKESEKKYRALVEYSADHIFMLDLDGTYIASNDRMGAFKIASGLSIVDRSIKDIYEPDVLIYYQSKIDEVIATNKPVSFEHKMNTPEGVMHHHDTLYPIYIDDELQFIGGICRDITEKMRLENEQRRLQKIALQSQKMEAIGTLAGGIAHDFNNVLSSIIGFTELALDEVVKGSTIEDSLQEVFTAGKRAKDLVKQILAFARQSEEKRQPVQVDAITREVLKFIRSSIPTTIEIKQNIESDSFIMGSASQVHQVLMNLFTNAAYAMENHGGILECSIKDVVTDRNSNLQKVALAPGSYVEITVSDTGEGIPPAILGSIYDPYFTTKGIGEGSGMGLAVVHGIVESYGGNIIVDSTLGKGTVFKIYLPITKKRIAHRAYEPEQLPSGNERILFVDDEAPIAKMSSQVLEGLGYSVTARTSSIEALELFRAKPNDFDLIITDMTMPNMTGAQLSTEMMIIRPDISVILCTGYSKKISDESAADIGIKAFAYKPVVKAHLAKTVRKVLDEAKE